MAVVDSRGEFASFFEKNLHNEFRSDQGRISSHNVTHTLQNLSV